MAIINGYVTVRKMVTLHSFRQQLQLDTERNMVATTVVVTPIIAVINLSTMYN